MSRYQAKHVSQAYNVLSNESRTATVFESEFDAVDQLLHAKNSLKVMLSNESLQTLKMELSSNPLISYDSWVSMESGFELSEQVSLEGTVTDAIKAGFRKIFETIKKYILAFFNFITMGKFKQKSENTKAKAEEVKKQSSGKAQEPVKAKSEPSSSPEPTKDKATAQPLSGTKKPEPKTAEQTKSGHMPHDKVEIPNIDCLAKEFHADGYSIVAEVVEGFDEFLNSGYFKAVGDFTPEGFKRVEKLAPYEQTKIEKHLKKLFDDAKIVPIPSFYKIHADKNRGGGALSFVTSINPEWSGLGDNKDKTHMVSAAMLLAATGPCILINTRIWGLSKRQPQLNALMNKISKDLDGIERQGEDSKVSDEDYLKIRAQLTSVNSIISALGSYAAQANRATTAYDKALDAYLRS